MIIENEARNESKVPLGGFRGRFHGRTGIQQAEMLLVY
jgi:hypothetical protein